jgi:hypothetical protein
MRELAEDFVVMNWGLMSFVQTGTSARVHAHTHMHTPHVNSRTKGR